MARGRKNYTLDEQLERVESEILNMENSLKELRKVKKELEEQIHQNKLSELYDLISGSGMSLEEVKEMINNKGQD